MCVNVRRVLKCTPNMCDLGFMHDNFIIILGGKVVQLKSYNRTGGYSPA